MATYETGNITNVGNLELLISTCTGYGATYNPSKVSIKLPALNTLLTNSQAANALVLDKLNLYSIAVDGMEILFDPFNPLTTRILAALKGSEVTKEFVTDAKSIIRKLTGKRASPKTQAASTTPTEITVENSDSVPSVDPKEISSSQLSVNNRIANFSRLINLLTSEPGYNPNETELKLTTLNAMLASMKTKNTALINTTTTLKNARINRDKVLYKDGTGLYDITVAVKAYVKSVFGATSPEYKFIVKIVFTKPR